MQTVGATRTEKQELKSNINQKHISDGANFATSARKCVKLQPGYSDRFRRVSRHKVDGHSNKDAVMCNAKALHIHVR